MLGCLLLGCSSGDGEDTSTTALDSGGGELPALDAWAEPYVLPELTGQPDVVLVTMDTFRVDAFSEQNTPNLHGLFQTGLWLAEHHAGSNWTSPTMTAILAGRDPLEVGYFPTRLSVAPLELALLAAVLGEEGYETFACTTNGVLNDAGLLRDYDHLGGRDQDAPADEHVDDCLEFEYGRLADRTGPVLVHTHFLDPHDAYRAPQEIVDVVMMELFGEVLEPLTLWNKTYELDSDRGAYAELERRWPEYADWERDLLTRFLQALYEAEVRFLDRALPRLFEGLEEVGLDLSEAVVIVASDHGEQRFERGLLTHARSVFTEETAALALFMGPGFTPARYEGLTTHKDLLALLYAALGLADTGTSGLSVLEGAPRIITGFQCAQSESISPLHPGRQAYALHSGGLRLVSDLDGSRALYDLRTDPQEQVDVLDDWTEDPAVLAAMEAAVDEVEAQAASGSDVCVE